MQRIEIPLSKRRTTLALAVSAIFLVLGIYVIAGSGFAEHFDEMIRYIVGGAIVAIFACLAVFAITKLLSGKPGIVLDEYGITDLTTAKGPGTIAWNEISSVRADSMMTTRVLLVYLYDADGFIGRHSGLTKTMLRSNRGNFGTPVAIAASQVKMSFGELHKLIDSYLTQYGGNERTQE
jgi:hypothetical protein